jgi:hypothetical protein
LSQENVGSNSLWQPEHFYRDGTSQADRVQAALDPDSISVDERSLQDLLAFARKYAKELSYFGVENDQVQAMGDWSSFLDTTLDLEEIVAFMQDPEKITDEKARTYRRPHFVLFLTFLQLLGHAQDQLNTFTRRHLDFYYQQVLRMVKRPARPDHVNVLVDLAAGTDQFLLLAGTLLNAGVDSAGQDLFYRTDQNIVATHAQVVRLSSLYIDKKITGVREARSEHRGTREEAFMRMLQVALGDPLPGDPLPPYISGQEIDYAFLLQLQQLVDFVHTYLYMGFSEFRSLIYLKTARDRSDREWQEINEFLKKAGARRTGDPNFQLPPADPRDFDANLQTALGGAPNYDGITQVKNIDDLYEQRIRPDVQEFIRQKLYFDDVNDFVRMMQIKVRIDNEWREINRLLEQAGQRKREPESYMLPTDLLPTDFQANLITALGDLVYPFVTDEMPITDLDEFHRRFLEVEKFFFMSAEDFSSLMAVAEQTDTTAQEWEQVYTILATAHKEKIYAVRRNRLREIREAQSFDAMLNFALSATQLQEENSVFARLEEYLRDPQDLRFLNEIRSTSAIDVTPEAWERVYHIVERAQRVADKLTEPVAQKEEWLNLYAAEDATSIHAESGIAGEEEYPRWKTFGQRAADADGESRSPASLAWAISSPLLSLSQGKRMITLTLGFQASSFDLHAIEPLLTDGSVLPFRAEVSTEKGWVEPESTAVRIGTYRSLIGDSTSDTGSLPALQWQFTIGEEVDAITPPATEDVPVQTGWPLLRLMLRPRQAEDTVTPYQIFKELMLMRTHLQVSVQGLIPLQMQNDETQLDAAKPFEPFGSYAVAGSRLYFGHPELICKRLDNLKFHVEWMGVPDDLANHYRNYPIAPDDASNALFTAQISLIDRRRKIVLNDSAQLFNQDAASTPHTVEITGLPAYTRTTEVETGDDLLAWNRYLQWELKTPDFQHAVYPALVASKSIEMAAAIASRKAGDTITADTYKVNPPYTPKIKKFSLDYTSSAEIRIDTYATASQSHRIFHLHPFGYSEIEPEPPDQRCRFLPHYHNEGELYIGIQSLQAPQDLSILFQMAEGSADPDLPPATLHWSYLSGNRWLSLGSGNLRLDTTRGLINSGILLFALPPAEPSTVMPAGLYWIRAAVPRYSNSVCDTVNIHAQAVSATFTTQDNGPIAQTAAIHDHLSRPLPPNTITDLAEALPEIATMRQPYTSYGGHPPEEDATFYTRVSERLRHKERALTLWDYEQMVLERFSQIYKAKCLPAAPNHPGQVEMIVIPDIRDKLPANPFEPKASADLIADIEHYLGERVPAFATLKVKNAHYIPVKVRIAVRFRPGHTPGYFIQRLNEDLNRFLSPWAYEEGADIVIGGRIYANVIIDFLERQPYVDYVAHIKLFSSDDGQPLKPVPSSASEGYFVETNRADGVLVAARQHEIDIIAEEDDEEERFAGINYMKIELDFMVEEDRAT